VELNDTYHGPESHGGHPSDVIMPVLAAAEHVGAGGREFITGVVLAYEVNLRISDTLPERTGFDCTTFAGIGIAVGAGKVLGLTPAQMHHCLSMGVVPANAINQGRSDHLSMWKAVAAGAAGRNGVIAALLARDGMEGPHLPFEGKNGWVKQVARQPVAIKALGGAGTPWKIEETLLKKRACCATSVSNILAAEKVAGAVRHRIGDIEQVLVDTYELSYRVCGSGEIHWNPDSRETADHSIPYGVAAALIDGTVTPRSFDEAHLWDPQLRALMQKVQVAVDAEFTRDYEHHPVWHRSRVTVVMRDGERLVGETGADATDLSTPMTREQVEQKFRGLTEDYLGKRRVDAILESLWNLDGVKNVATLPPAFVFA
jgi:2-methylcitrate dehydratase